MTHSEPIELMHAVLDGEATPEQAHQLERLLAADPAMRAQFDELQSLFDALRQVPKPHPPEGLVAAVTAALPAREPQPAGLRQLFSKSRVIESISIRPRATITGQTANIHSESRVDSTWEIDRMSQQNSKSTGKGKIWIGAGIAAAAVLVIGQYVDFPSTGQSVSGAVVPAQRFRAPQMTSDDVRVGNPSGGQSTQIDAASQGSAANGALNATQGGALNATQGGALNASQGGALNATQGGALNATQGGALNATQGGALNATQGGALNATQGGALNATQGGALNATQGGALNATQGGALNATQGGALNATQGGALNATRGGALNATQGGALNAAK